MKHLLLPRAFDCRFRLSIYLLISSTLAHRLNSRQIVLSELPRILDWQLTLPDNLNLKGRRTRTLLNPKTPPPQPPLAPASFEESLRGLEETVERLEAGELPLEESLVLFEKGVSSLKHCHAILDQAEKRVRMLVKSAGGPGVEGSAAILEDVGVAPSTHAAPPAPARKKSPKQSVDLESSTGQNVGSIPEPDSNQHPARPEPKGRDETGPGGSLFGVSQ